MSLFIKKRNSVTIRLTDEEKAKIIHKIQDKNLSCISDYVRNLIKRDIEKEHWFWDIEALEYLQKKGIIDKEFVNGVKSGIHRKS